LLPISQQRSKGKDADVLVHSVKMCGGVEL